MQCFEYEPETGRILCFYDVSENIIDYMKEHGKKILCGTADQEKEYVDIDSEPPKLKKRPYQLTTQNKKEISANLDDEDFLTLSNFPVPCEIQIGDSVYEIEDDENFDWGTGMKGDYEISVKSFPFLDWEGGVRAI